MNKHKKNTMNVFGTTTVRLPSETGFVPSNMMSLDQAWLYNNNERPFAVLNETR